MKKWYVDFGGYFEIEAANMEEAIDKFWDRFECKGISRSDIYSVIPEPEEEEKEVWEE